MRSHAGKTQLCAPVTRTPQIISCRDVQQNLVQVHLNDDPDTYPVGIGLAFVNWCEG
jgi:hypothetical protein